jgi:pyrimidine operon attenuation protein/uracil phosphoribosyltransferase
MHLQRKKKIMDRKKMHRAVIRLANEVIERNNGTEQLVIIGIRTRGVPLARRLAEELVSIEPQNLPFGILDITLYRDDLQRIDYQPIVRKTDISFDINNRKIILVDDVLNTGRTVRAALDELMDFGRPAAIQLVVLIDRGGRELPVHADFVGRTVMTFPDETVEVMLQEEDGEDAVYVSQIIYDDRKDE